MRSRTQSRGVSALLVVGWCVIGTLGAGGAARGAESVRVMSFNIWVGGEAGQQPLPRTAAVIKEARADIVGLQETEGTAPKGKPRPDRAAELARMLGWHYLNQQGGTGIISRFKIVAATPRRWGAKLSVPSGREVYLF